MKEYKKIILTRPKIVLDTNCPKCKSFDIIALPEMEVKCKNCATKFDSELGINIYYSVAKKINMVLGRNNGVYIIGERNTSKVFHPDDILKPRTKLEDDIWHAMLEIHKNFTDQKCWEVTPITNEYDVDYKILCKDCGYCKNCVTCNRCGEKFSPKEVKTKSGIERRFTCPKCNSKSYKDTVINKFKKKNECPYCSSHNVVHAKFTSDRRKCPKCKSKNITEPRKIPVYRLLIERQKRFWLDE